jgi:DNA-binding NarL/FixJ family response regulator
MVFPDGLPLASAHTPSAAETLTVQAKRVLIADDHPLYRDALQAILPRACNATQVVEASSQPEVTGRVTSDADFDLIILDLNLPGATDLSCLRYIRSVAPLTPIVVVSGIDDPATMSEVVMAGAAGYVPKSAPSNVLVDAIRVIMSGGTYLPAAAIVALRHSNSRTPGTPESAEGEHLTARQMRVLELLAQGLSNKQIARELDISEITVKAHVSLILKKLGVSNRTQAAIEAHRLLAGGGS